MKTTSKKRSSRILLLALLVGAMSVVSSTGLAGSVKINLQGVNGSVQIFGANDRDHHHGYPHGSLNNMYHVEDWARTNAGGHPCNTYQSSSWSTNNQPPGYPYLGYGQYPQYGGYPGYGGGGYPGYGGGGYPGYGGGGYPGYGGGGYPGYGAYPTNDQYPSFPGYSNQLNGFTDQVIGYPNQGGSTLSGGTSVGSSGVGGIYPLQQGNYPVQGTYPGTGQIYPVSNNGSVPITGSLINNSAEIPAAQQLVHLPSN